ncbi:DUF349 domain-containing protein [Halomonas urumqiensis]|uniref:DUF349 domain-containing protein n=1 Tax=Halomonas urumqiensis TaxID=1684789 RepID=A0A2N7UIW2_9GAMM|nr:DUF349 domain-containing protein [Halomonas urumqiensis]PMR80387.1 DUF349 domain-containing protein [Halomonas urumqiensis]PTB01508.1 DUF349 domain-containing protein [Halomonas urumqiensis]GHE22412.1 hypothetical protein GCM10017767_29330 [Halomonas urumqiensis]
MSGLFRRFFAPRWEHRDPAVRLQAIPRLDTARPEQRQALERLALDPDVDVRRAALARLDDPERLLALLDQNANADGGCNELHTRLIELINGRDGNLALGARIELAERLDQPDLLAAVALQGDNQQLRLAALARISDEQALIRQACDNGIAAVRHAAAARVESEAGLAHLAQQAKRDRQVMRQARERLNRIRADAASIAAARDRREALINDLERHANATWEPLYAGRFRHLMRQWASLDDSPEASQERRYQDACLRCRKVIGDHEAHERSREVAHQQREDADQARVSLVEALEESLDALYRSDSISRQDIDSLRAQKQLLANRWQALSDQHLADEALRERYDTARQSFERISQAWVRFEERAGELERALADGDDERLRALVDACGWPDNLAPTALLHRVRQHLAYDNDANQPSDLTAQADAYKAALDQFEKLLESGAFKGASRVHQRLRQQAETLPAKYRQPHEARLKRLGAQLAELRDWRGFVAGPKRDQLCESIAALAEDETLSDAQLDRRHRQLVKEWKSLGDAAANREQAGRFRAASDRIHERLAPWRARLDEQRQHNLETREALCEQLETLLAQPAEQADPDALRQIRDKAREQWRLASPVPRDQTEAIGRRFGRIRHELQALIDQRALVIASAKRELIEQARALTESDLPASRSADQAKGLQRQWRELGRAPKGEEQALWREFRGLCDTIFASREAERDDRAQRARHRLDAMQALIDRLDAWQPATSHDAPLLEEAIREASALEPLPAGRRTEGMRRRWTGIIRARSERLARLAVIDEVERWRAVKPLLDAHLEADAASLSGEHPSDVAIPDGLTLTHDMANAHAQRNIARHSPSGNVEERLARVRVHLSLLAVGRVSHRDDPLRLAIQVERLNENLGREPSRAEELHGVLRELLAIGPVPPAEWAREVGEFDHMLEQLTRLPPP